MDMDRLKASLAAVIDWRTQRLDYAGLQPATVIAQSASDGSLDVRFEDSGYPQLQGVKLLPPAPGCLVLVSPGARVMVGWLGCHADMPVAVAWDTGSTTQVNVVAPTINLGSASPGDALALASLVLARLATLASDLNTFIGVYNLHTHICAAPGVASAVPVSLGTATGTPASVASAVVKAI